MTPEEIQRVKDLLPTTLGSEEIRGTIAADILRRSVFSARMASATKSRATTQSTGRGSDCRNERTPTQCA